MNNEQNCPITYLLTLFADETVAPDEYVELIEHCWHTDPKARPAFLVPCLALNFTTVLAS